MNKPTTAYRLYEDADEYGDYAEVTIACLWNLEDAEAFRDEHNRHSKEFKAWQNKSFEYALQNAELIAKRRECQAVREKLQNMDKNDPKREALKKRLAELPVLIENMRSNLCNMWKAENPFITTALSKNGECFIETLIIQ